MAGLRAHGVALRYVAPRLSMVEAGEEEMAEVVAAEGVEVVFRARLGEGEGFYLTDHLVEPLVAGVEVVWRDFSGWALLKVRDPDRARVQDTQHFLWPLPAAYSLRGWQRAVPRGKPVAVLQKAAVERLLEGIEPQTLEGHARALALKDPTIDGGVDNWRTRFARRPETFESTQYIQRQLEAALGADNVQIEAFRRSFDEPEMYNVVGTLPGTDPEAGYYIVCAHYDAIGTRTRQGWDWRVDPAPGADDNASGTALVLESARALAGQRLPWSVRFIAFSGEELGLWGSRQYADAAAARGDRILGVLNFDMIGFNDLSQRLELVTNRSSRWLVEQMAAVNERYGIGLRIDVLEDDFARLSDHAPFWVHGWDAVLGIENYLPTDSTTVGVRQGLYRLNTQYHTVIDLPDSLNGQLMAQTTRLAVATLAQYALEEGTPNLAVFTGDLAGADDDDLRVRLSNIGLGALEGGFRLQVARCEADSSRCEVFFDEERRQDLAPGATAELRVPWQRFGDTVFRLDVAPLDGVQESETADNRAFQRVRLVPQSRIAVFPNPFRPAVDELLRFSGVPLNAIVRIYTVAGELVWSGQEDVGAQRNLYTNEVVWSGVVHSGHLAGDLQGPPTASGVYVYTIHSAAGELLRRGKVGVVH